MQSLPACLSALCVRTNEFARNLLCDRTDPPCPQSVVQVLPLLFCFSDSATQASSSHQAGTRRFGTPGRNMPRGLGNGFIVASRSRVCLRLVADLGLYLFVKVRLSYRVAAWMCICGLYPSMFVDVKRFRLCFGKLVRLLHSVEVV